MMSNFEIIRSNRRTIAIEIKNDCRIVVRAPLQMSQAEVQRFVESKAAWIQTHLHAVEQRQNEPVTKLTDGEIHELADAAMKDIPNRVVKYAKQIGVSVGRITIRNQRTRWGSCSAKGNLNFNCLLMLCPEDIRDYVVVHELCHRKQLNHSAQFWHEVESVLPDYLSRRNWLKEKGNELIRRL